MKPTNRKFSPARWTIIALSLLLVASGSSPAATYSWTAASGMYPDDADPSMFLSNSALPENPVLSTNELALVTDQPDEWMYYCQQGEGIAMPATNFFIEASVMFVSGSFQRLGQSPLMIFFTTAPSVGGALCIFKDVVWMHSGNSKTRGASVSTPTDDTFHLYRIEVDATAVAGSPVRVYKDGSPILISGLLGTSWVGPTPLIWFGDGSSTESGTSRWRTFRHNAAVRDSSDLRLSLFTAVEFCWLAESNKLYQPQWAPRVGPNDWSNFGGRVEGDGTFKCIIDSTKHSPQKIYRVKVIAQ